MVVQVVVAVPTTQITVQLDEVAVQVYLVWVLRVLFKEHAGAMVYLVHNSQVPVSTALVADRREALQIFQD